MEIVLSGLDQAACEAMVGTTLWNRESVRWMDPDEWLASASAGDGPASDARYVWLYRSPFRLASRGREGDAGADLATWLKRNLRALNLRRQLGRSLLLVNAETTPPADLRAELAGTEAARDDRSRVPEDAGSEGPVTEAIIALLFQSAAPRYCEVFDLLEAASWRSAPGRSPAAPGTVPDESQLFALLDFVRRRDAPAAPQAQAQAQHSEDAQLRASLQAEQAALVEARKATAAAQRALTEAGLAHEREEARLVAQLHMVQEELEAYYLENADLGRSLAEERQAHATQADSARELQQQLDQARSALAAERQARLAEANAAMVLRSSLSSTQAELVAERKARSDDSAAARTLRSELKRVHKELQGMGQAAAEARAAAPPGGRLARLLPSRRRAMREHREAERHMQAALEAISRSEWFDRDWYLKTYPDVKSANIDPALHYLEFGWKEDRNPGPSFDTSYYLATNLDVAKSGINPLWHFIAYGLSEGRLPAPGPRHRAGG